VCVLSLLPFLSLLSVLSVLPLLLFPLPSLTPFQKLAQKAKAMICCRTQPGQKASVVKTIMDDTKKVCCAIGKREREEGRRGGRGQVEQERFLEGIWMGKRIERSD
jgi:hypothetical protein